LTANDRDTAHGAATIEALAEVRARRTGEPLADGVRRTREDLDGREVGR
jgi:hypothetical protein